MKHFAIGRTETVTYGHGSFGEETHITHKNAYAGEMDFHPIFENRNDANDYILSLENNYNLFPVELEVKTKNHISEAKLNNANKKLCVRPFSDLIREIEFNQKKIIPIRELGIIAGFHYSVFPNINFDRGTMNPKGSYYISNIKRELETIDKFCAFVFSSDMLAFYYVNNDGKKEFVKNQVKLCQKLREWGFIE